MKQEASTTMPATIRSLGRAIVLMAVVVGASCAPSTQSQTPAVCDGVTSDAGGCTTERHDFTGTTCVELAREWGAFVDRLVSAILAGPEDVRGESKSVRLKQAVVITTGDMNERMRELSLRSQCDVEGVLAVAEPIFSEPLRSGVGRAMYDGLPEVTYDDWISDVRTSLQVIDDED